MSLTNSLCSEGDQAGDELVEFSALRDAGLGPPHHRFRVWESEREREQQRARERSRESENESESLIMRERERERASERERERALSIIVFGSESPPLSIEYSLTGLQNNVSVYNFRYSANFSCEAVVYE